MTAEETRTPDDSEGLLDFVERLALILNQAGMERMPARVFAYVLAEDSDTYTAAQLAEGLGVSRAAISGATRTLVQGGLLDRGREPGSRVDHFRVYDEDVWATINAQRIPLLDRYKDVIIEGIDIVGVDTRGGQRLLQTLAYFEFLGERLWKLNEDWHEHKDELMTSTARRLAERSG